MGPVRAREPPVEGLRLCVCVCVRACVCVCVCVCVYAFLYSALITFNFWPLATACDVLRNLLYVHNDEWRTQSEIREVFPHAVGCKHYFPHANAT